MSNVLEVNSTAPLAAQWRVAAFLELAKPRILAMVLVATAVGFYLGLPGWAGVASGALLLSTLLGTALSVAGANAINQYMEVEQDGKMLRTCRRPLPSGRLERRDALAFGILCSAGGVLWLTLCVGLLPGLLSAVAVLSYVFAYTPLKRSTPLCVLIGAVPGAMPPLIGWAAGGGTLGLGAWLLFAILFFWQTAHFATIAWQHREDYARAGCVFWPTVDPSGKRTNRALMMHTLWLIAASLLPAVYGQAGAIYAVGAAVLGMAFLACGAHFVMRKTTEAARFHLHSSLTYLPTLFALMMLDKM